MTGIWFPARAMPMFFLWRGRCEIGWTLSSQSCQSPTASPSHQLIFSWQDMTRLFTCMYLNMYAFGTSMLVYIDPVTISYYIQIKGDHNADNVFLLFSWALLSGEVSTGFPHVNPPAGNVYSIWLGRGSENSCVLAHVLLVQDANSIFYVLLGLDITTYYFCLRIVKSLRSVVASPKEPSGSPGQAYTH